MTEEMMDFGDVIKALKKDSSKRFARKGWNGRGIYIRIQNPDKGSMMLQPYLYIVTIGLDSDNAYASRGIVPWIASQTDMLADDWVEVKG